MKRQIIRLLLPMSLLTTGSAGLAMAQMPKENNQMARWCWQRLSMRIGAYVVQNMIQPNKAAAMPR
jgi:hypothetical protein